MCKGRPLQLGESVALSKGRPCNAFGVALRKRGLRNSAPRPLQNRRIRIAAVGEQGRDVVPQLDPFIPQWL